MTTTFTYVLYLFILEVLVLYFSMCVCYFLLHYNSEILSWWTVYKLWWLVMDPQIAYLPPDTPCESRSTNYAGVWTCLWHTGGTALPCGLSGHCDLLPPGGWPVNCNRRTAGEGKGAGLKDNTGVGNAFVEEFRRVSQLWAFSILWTPWILPLIRPTRGMRSWTKGGGPSVNWERQKRHIKDRSKEEVRARREGEEDRSSSY